MTILKVPTVLLALAALTVPSWGQVAPSKDAVPATVSATAETKPVYGPPAPLTTGAVPDPSEHSTAAQTVDADPELVAAIRDWMDQSSESGDEATREDQKALADFYAARNGAPLWVTREGINDQGRALIAEIENAAAFGLDPKAFRIPDMEKLSTSGGAAAMGAADTEISMAALKYARHARGGRIPEPAEMLNSNLDRKPQLHAPKDVLEKLTHAPDTAAALKALHPVHPQFEKLRQAFLAASGDGKGGGRLNVTAQRLRANMEFWRWMWDDLGDLYVFNNIPEFMQYVVHDGKVVRTERIVVGLLDKPSSVFSRQLKHVVLRPQWRVPTSIMVHELWPSLLRGGGYMRQFGLEITTKTGEPRDWRRIDWSKDDIRNYHVWQPPGPRSVLGVVKFSFPSQHTIFMHDTPDRWMFNSRQRTLSHGCLRVRNPVDLAEIILDYDKGWDKAKIKQLIRSGPRNNEVEISKRLPIHLAYFTAWVGDDGKVKVFRDIYGHERRVRQALNGEWNRIDKGRNHLAPVKPRFDPKTVSRAPPGSQTVQSRSPRKRSVGNIITNAISLDF